MTKSQDSVHTPQPLKKKGEPKQIRTKAGGGGGIVLDFNQVSSSQENRYHLRTTKRGREADREEGGGEKEKGRDTE